MAKVAGGAGVGEEAALAQRHGDSGDGDDGEPFWVSIDPTNRGLAGERHVKIGHGRHYADVPPIKGVYRGAANADLETRVTMTRVDSAAPVAASRG